MEAIEETVAKRDAEKNAKKRVKKRKASSEDGSENPPTKRVKEGTSSTASSSTASSSSTSANASQSTGVSPSDRPAVEEMRKNWKSLFDIYFAQDIDQSLGMFESCDEIRRRIRRHLRLTGLSKAAFLRDIARAAWPAKTPMIQSKQLTDFLAKKGATSGSTSRVFYGAYVYFEKKRIFEDKPKSEHRKKMERAWLGEGGMPRKEVLRQAYFVIPGMSVRTDDLGRVSCGY